MKRIDDVHITDRCEKCGKDILFNHPHICEKDLQDLKAESRRIEKKAKKVIEESRYLYD